MTEYKMIPVDKETYERIVDLCSAYEFGKRGQGAIVRKLVKAEHEKLSAAKLLPKGVPQGDDKAKKQVSVEGV